jgi:predicted RNase H-like HicB family nuclease
MRCYIALIHKDADSDFGVSFPDLPGCITAGGTIEDAKALAIEALALHVKGMVEDGETPPEPRSLDLVRAEPASRDALAFPALLPQGC